MAGLQGLLLATILLFSKRFGSTANRFFAMTLLGVSIIVCYDFFYYSFEEEELPLVIQYMPIYIRTAIPIGLYFFVRYLIDPKSRLNKWERLWYLPILMEVFVELAYIPVNFFLEENTIAGMEYALLITEESIGLLTSVVLLSLVVQKINRYQKFLLNNYSTLSGKSLIGLRNLIIIFLVIVVIWLLSHMLFILGYDNEGIYTLVSLGLILFLFLMGYFVILHYSLFKVIPYDAGKTQLKAKKKLSPKTDEYHKKLLDMMETETFYTDPELNLPYLAELLKISPGYLSQIIKEKEDKNFFEFVNQYRVAEAKKKLMDTDYNQYSIMGIALESGFNSKSTFNSLFKKYTGQTPSSFKKSFQASH